MDIKKAITSWCDKAGSTKLDYVTAPGQDVYSADLGGSYTYKSGTSMAAPHVAGIAALLKSHNKNLTAAQVENLLTSTASNQQSIKVNEAFVDRLPLLHWYIRFQIVHSLIVVVVGIFRLFLFSRLQSRCCRAQDRRTKHYFVLPKIPNALLATRD